MTYALSPHAIRHFAEQFREAHPRDSLSMAVIRIPRLVMACSFGPEDMVLLDLLQSISPEAHVFYLDTDLLFPETYALRDRAVERYSSFHFQRVSPAATLEQQATECGEELWAADPDGCCRLRKVEPLRRTLAGYDGWITGIRRMQSPTRARAEVFEMDDTFHLVKVNPLVMWSTDDVWDYIREHDVPYNPLHDAGYPSIGCAPCTRPVKPGEDPRSGRWSGLEKTECGLHK